MQWPKNYRSIWKERLRQLWADYEHHTHRKEQIGRQIERLYLQLQERAEEPAPFEQISAKQLGRLIGELGPIGDYEREIKITKKGRPLARKILGQMTYQLIPKDELFGSYYRRKLQQGMRKGKAFVAVMRKLLKLIVGLYKSDQPYDPDRVFTCRSQYAGAT